MAGFYCCCCESHLDAAKFIGNTYIVLHIIGLVVTCIEFAEPIAIGTQAILVLIDWGFIYGCFNKNVCLMITWSVVTAISTLGFSGTIIWIISTSFSVILFLIVIAITLVNLWVIWSVSLAVTEINQEKRNAVISIAGQEVGSNPQIKWCACA